LREVTAEQGGKHQGGAEHHRTAGEISDAFGERWMQRLGWMERAGERWWPILGGVYLLMATKRVTGGRLLQGRQWRTVRSPAVATAPVARSDTLVSRPLTEKDRI
jgi:hypothetical protein